MDDCVCVFVSVLHTYIYVAHGCIYIYINMFIKTKRMFVASTQDYQVYVFLVKKQMH